MAGGVYTRIIGLSHNVQLGIVELSTTDSSNSWTMPQALHLKSYFGIDNSIYDGWVAVGIICTDISFLCFKP